MACLNSYKILAVQEVWHYAQWDQYSKDIPGSGPFAEMMNVLMAKKIANSGYPSHVVTPEQKAEYKRRIEEHEGIELGEIVDNPAKKGTSKLTANGFWGKL